MGGEMFQALVPAVSRFRGDGRRVTGRYGKELRTCVRWAALSVLLAALPCWASRAVVDELGRQVVVPDHPHRVVCLAPSIVDTMYARSAGEDIAGITDYVKYPEEARKKASVGSPLSPSLEVLVSLHPDLVIGFQGGQQLEMNQQIAAL